jgi:hypothetical protein
METTSQHRTSHQIGVMFSRHMHVQAKMMVRRLEDDPGLDPANDTSVDPVPDLLAALALYPKRAEPLMQLSRHSEWLRDKYASCSFSFLFFTSSGSSRDWSGAT